jgi:hypothetical protein
MSSNRARTRSKSTWAELITNRWKDSYQDGVISGNLNAAFSQDRLPAVNMTTSLTRPARSRCSGCARYRDCRYQTRFYLRLRKHCHAYLWAVPAGERLGAAPLHERDAVRRYTPRVSQMSLLREVERTISTLNRVAHSCGDCCSSVTSCFTSTRSCCSFDGAFIVGLPELWTMFTWR